MEINISQRLKELRKQFGYSQLKVAKGIGLKRGTYQAYEKEKATPPIITLFALAAFYGFIGMDDLLGIKPLKKTPGLKKPISGPPG